MYDSFLKNEICSNGIVSMLFENTPYKIDDLFYKNIIKIHNTNFAVYIKDNNDMLLITTLPKDKNENMKVFLNVNGFIHNHRFLKDAC